MDCFNNYVGLRQCNSEVEPVSGLFINSLGGITTEILQKISTGEQATYAQVWADVQLIAGRRFYTDAIGRLRKRYILKNVRSRVEWQPSEIGAANEPASAQERGLRMLFDFPYYTFQSFTIETVVFVANFAGDIELRIMDKRGTLLYTKTVTVAIGLNQIAVDKIFAVDEILIGVDFTVIDGYETSFSQGIVDAFCHSCHVYCRDCNPVITGFTKVGSTITATGRNTHGIGVYGYLGCDFTSLICSNKELLCSAWLYLLGNEVIQNILASNRTVQATTVDRKKYEELRDFYQVEYEKALDDALAGLVIDAANDCCVQCNENPVREVWLP